MEKLLKDNKDKIPAATVKEIEDAIAEVHKLREKGSADELKTAMDRLEKASHKAAEELYKTAAPGPGAEAGGPGPQEGAPEEKKKDNVVDAEFKQV
jgi:molecular chaperone DnaK